MIQSKDLFQCLTKIHLPYNTYNIYINIYYMYIYDPLFEQSKEHKINRVFQQSRSNNYLGKETKHKFMF